jgi:hypothetical protein
MPFIDAVIEDMQTLGDAALDTSAPFDEAAVLNEVIRPTRPSQQHKRKAKHECWQ